MSEAGGESKIAAGGSGDPPPVERKPVVLNADDFLVKNAPDSIRYIPNFISEEEERQLLNHVYAAPKPKWDTLKNRRLQNYGGLVGQHGLIPDGDLPDWLETIIDRVMTVQSGFPEDRRPNHVLINEYLPQQGIMPHTDGPAFFSLISTISLGGCTCLDFYEPMQPGQQQPLDQRHVGSMLLQPRSLVFIKDRAYSELLHGIRELAVDTVTEKIFNRPARLAVGTQIPRRTRVSLTIRNVPQVKKLNIAGLLNRKP
ncbi:Fe2OG dioxygenase domain-containing protein [Aphelenchoides fujianensis]|nr:Fe2OG dioxygenase domain-containing protein [Aphelenchoides fujianensis]